MPAKRFLSACSLLTIMALPLSLNAHHGAGLFDGNTSYTVAGTVAEFQFINPHVLIFVNVTDEDGSVTRWGGELTSPNRLARMGTAVRWHRGLLSPGDRIEMTGHPARNGAPAMSITQVVDGAGTVLIGEAE